MVNGSDLGRGPSFQLSVGQLDIKGSGQIEHQICVGLAPDQPKVMNGDPFVDPGERF